MDKSFGILHKIVQATNMRHKVISSNIANADTPGYKARDIKFNSFLKNEMKLMTTDPKHVGIKRGRINGKIVTERNPSWRDGNNVELNNEVARMTENGMKHDAAIRIMNSKIKMYKNAIKGR